MADNTYNDAQNTQNGSDPGNWSLGTVPAGTDVAIFDATTGNACTFAADISCAGIDRQATYNGALDADTYNITTTGNITLNGTVSSVKMGSGTWTCGGTIDWSALTNFYSETSTLVMTGDGTSIIGKNAAVDDIYHLTVSANITVDIPENMYASGEVYANGEIDIASGKNLYCVSAKVYVPAGGEISGAGRLTFSAMATGSGVLLNEGTISCERVQFAYFDGAVYAPGTYPIVSVSFYQDDRTFATQAGAYICGKHYFLSAVAVDSGHDCTFDTTAATSYDVADTIRFDIDGTGNIIIDNIGSCDWRIAGNVYWSTRNALAIWKKGGGSLTYDPSANQSVDWSAAHTFEDVILAGTNNAVTTFTDNWTADSFAAEAGNFDPNGKTMVTVGDFKIYEGAQLVSILSSTTLWDGVDLTVGGDFDVAGEVGDYCNLQGDGGWTLNAAGTKVVRNVIVSGSNAADGVEIPALESTDEGGTTNWTFGQTKIPLIVDSDGSMQRLQSGDGIFVGQYDLPPEVGNIGESLIVIASVTGNRAVWDRHTIVSHSDTTATGAELETLTDGSDATALHTHDGSDHDIADHNDTTATGAELETLTDGSDATALHTHDGSDHDIADHNDTTATGAELETLTDGSDATALHTHDGSDHDIADHNDTTATGAELNTLTDGNDATALHTHDGSDHDIADHNDTTATGAELETLTDGSDATALHVHDGSDHDIADHNDTTATGAELETLTDGSDADSLHTHSGSNHTIASHNDTTATGAELETLTDGSDATALHTHNGSDHDIADHNDTTATGAELETLTDGSDATALHTHDGSDHDIADHNDTTATGAELETLTDGSDATALHIHDGSDHDIADHNDTTATGAELETLTDGSDATALHTHDGSDHDIADHNDTTATGAELETLTDGSNADTLHAHTYAAEPSGNVTYYIDTSGNDSTGNGSIAVPWKTMNKALTVLYDTEFERLAVATIELAGGVYEGREDLILAKAPNLVIQGNTVETYTVSSVSGVVDNDPSYDVTLVVDTTVGMSTDFYLGILSDTDKKYLNGGWEIISVDDGNHVTVRIDSPLVAATTGNVAADVIMPTSVLEMLDVVGLNMQGARTQITNLTITKGTGGEYAIAMRGCTNSSVGPNVIVNGFPSDAINLKDSLCTFTDVYISDCAIGLYAQDISKAYIVGGAYSGCVGGIRARSSYVEVDGAFVAGNSSEGLRGIEWCLITAINTDFFGNGTGVMVSGVSMARVQGSNTFASNGTDRSPATGEGNLNAYMQV